MYTSAWTIWAVLAIERDPAMYVHEITSSVRARSQRDRATWRQAAPLSAEEQQEAGEARCVRCARTSCCRQQVAQCAVSHGALPFARAFAS
eukprot:5877270-Pleurochrysis_carterae.AAC.2